MDNERFGRIRLTHVNLNDGTAEGIAFLDIPAFCVQYHPEASPGPTDAHYLFTAFGRLMDGREDYLDIDIAADRLAGWTFGVAGRHRAGRKEAPMPKRTDIKPSSSSAPAPSSSGRRASSTTRARRRARCSRPTATAWCS